ncbi:hypothetical protein E2C01_069895 [Portunus trituberculatus]|uniref:Uncharacterized protein n=1 Tax=Portunus trituberculatus TaxID=210409 RepID=A0A5B7I056_PORTR|nr:hypothetical protein [Portunus trituberculatus]
MSRDGPPCSWQPPVPSTAPGPDTVLAWEQRAQEWPRRQEGCNKFHLDPPNRKGHLRQPARPTIPPVRVTTAPPPPSPPTATIAATAAHLN